MKSLRELDPPFALRFTHRRKGTGQERELILDRLDHPGDGWGPALIEIMIGLTDLYRCDLSFGLLPGCVARGVAITVIVNVAEGVAPMISVGLLALSLADVVRHLLDRS